MFKVKFTVWKFCKYSPTSVIDFSIYNNIFQKSYLRLKALDNVVMLSLHFSQYCHLMIRRFKTISN